MSPASAICCDNSGRTLVALQDSLHWIDFLSATLTPVLTTRLDGPPNRLALRTKGGVGEEEIKVTVGPDGRLTDIGKTLPPKDALGESVGIEIFSSDFVKKLWATLERRAKHENGANEWYEASFLELMRQGEAIYPVDLGELACMEIDTVEDLERARRVECFGRVAQAWSLYETRTARSAREPLATGINSIQLLREPSGWRVVGLLWDETHGQADHVVSELFAGGAR